MNDKILIEMDKFNVLSCEEARLFFQDDYEMLDEITNENELVIYINSENQEDVEWALQEKYSNPSRIDIWSYKKYSECTDIIDIIDIMDIKDFEMSPKDKIIKLLKLRESGKCGDIEVSEDEI